MAFAVFYLHHASSRERVKTIPPHYNFTLRNTPFFFFFVLARFGVMKEMTGVFDQQLDIDSDSAFNFLLPHYIQGHLNGYMLLYVLYVTFLLNEIQIYNKKAH